VVQRPTDVGAFEFVVLASLRAAQLIRGCTPLIESTHKMITTAQMEVAERRIVRAPAAVLVLAGALAPAEPASESGLSVSFELPA
jgi:hypothetical protein